MSQPPLSLPDLPSAPAGDSESTEAVATPPVSIELDKPMGTDAAEEGAKEVIDVADTGVADVVADDVSEAAPAGVAPNPRAPARPPLQRNQMQSAPAPISQPPPPAPPSAQAADSLSLAQLRQIVSEFPRSEAVAYDFVYSDTGPHAEEIDEWFNYNFGQWMRLNAAQRSFEARWEQYVEELDEDSLWDDAEEQTKSNFTRKVLDGVGSNDPQTRSECTGCIVYLILGRWMDTAGPLLGDTTKLRSLANSAQVEAIRSSVELVAKVDGLPILWDSLRSAYEDLWVEEPMRPQIPSLQAAQDLLMNLMTILYICIQVATNDRSNAKTTYDKLQRLEPNLATFMLTAAAKLRWQDGNLTPVTQTLLLLWKSVLLVFGGSNEIAETKDALRETSADDKDSDMISASPLDYHVFRQELTSKYPSYVPPQLSIPLEPDNTSLLPPLRNQAPRNNGSNGIVPAPPGTQNGGASILHQPVHIATPAPSPPPSPAVGGKGGKKQNYQTNQNFPFMYPPLDSSSNSAGGKGGAGLQDVLVGRRWEGSDVPASILEAGELFSKRVRMTRATRQLWQEREKFMKFERGWDPSEGDDDIEALDLDSLTIEDDIPDDKILETIEKRRKVARGVDIDFGPHADLDDKIKHRLQAIEAFYEASLPQLQSLVMVLMKGILASVTACVTLPGNGQQHSGMPMGATKARLNGGVNRSHDSDVVNGSDGTDSVLDELDAARSREIESKAATGVILLLLKWLKLSHILKFEYLTQLLLDSNYLPLVLKLFAHQDIQQVVDSKTDRKEHSFFQVCNERVAQRNGKMGAEPTEIDGADESSEDDVAPPPIKRRRSPPGPVIPAVLQSHDSSMKTDGQAPTRPEVDELGYAINPLPKEPITDFSRRNFFALINYLRIMQKICKNKAHRNLLLVQYKSSNIIRKSLKIPQQELRLYTLKLFKNQVPYCGRKWRQSNMRVITAVYLHCRPELRDEWLAGSDVDAEVEEALPLEQGLRSLTHWFNVRRYPNQMAEEVIEALQNEQDFFKRELDKFDLWNGSAAPDSAGAEWDHPLPGWG